MMTRGAVAALLVAKVNAASSGSPLEKVVQLIQEMSDQVEKEAKEDETAYSKYACWCTTNDKEKTEAIDTASTRIEEQGSFVEEAAAKEGELKTQMEALASDMEEDKAALEEAAALRNKENEEFLASETDMKETLSALKNAIDVLKKVQLLQQRGGAVSSAVAEEARTALIQVGAKNVHQRFPQFKDVMERDLFDVLGSIGKAGTSMRGSAFAQDEPREGGAAKGAKSYNSRSGAIFGIIEEMNDEFTRDLANAQKSEASATAMYEKLKAAKEGEIAAAHKQSIEKSKQLTQIMHEAVMAKRDIKKLNAAKDADEEFLANLKKSCAKEEQNYNDRVKVRSDEVTALSETMKILTDDDARELFSKTTSFVQLSTSAASAARREQRAMARIAQVAKKHNNWGLAALAVRMRLDSFEKVKKTMDNMVAELKVQQNDEIEKKELCDKQIDEAEDLVKEGEENKADLDEKFEKTTNDLATLDDDIAKLTADVKANEIGIKQAGENRKEENMLFKQSIADQRATINILHKALDRLKDFYAKDSALVQIRAHRAEPGAAAPPPPPAPAGYTKSAGAGGVLQMISTIISDAEATEAEMEVSENNAQGEYAQFVKDSSASLEADRAAIIEKEELDANSDGILSETKEAQLANDEELKKAKDLLSAHHTDCDWILKYFDMRQQGRQEEMDSIEEAKAILSGADFGK